MKKSPLLAKFDCLSRQSDVSCVQVMFFETVSAGIKKVISGAFMLGGAAVDNVGADALERTSAFA